MTIPITAADLAVGQVYPWPRGERRIVAIDLVRALVDWTWRSTDPDGDTTKEYRNTLSIEEFLKDVNGRRCTIARAAIRKAGGEA